MQKLIFNFSACLISVFDYLNKQNPTFMNPVYDAKKTSRLACPKRMWVRLLFYSNAFNEMEQTEMLLTLFTFRNFKFGLTFTAVRTLKTL